MPLTGHFHLQAILVSTIQFLVIYLFEHVIDSSHYVHWFVYIHQKVHNTTPIVLFLFPTYLKTCSDTRPSRVDIDARFRFVDVSFLFYIPPDSLTTLSPIVAVQMANVSDCESRNDWEIAKDATLLFRHSNGANFVPDFLPLEDLYCTDLGAVTL